MVMDHSDSETGNPLLPHGLLFLINSKGSFICTILEREIAQWVASGKFIYIYYITKRHERC